MTPEEYAKLLRYIQENNGWGDNMYDVNCVRHRRAVKYVDACFDSRDGKIWSIKFRNVTPGEGKTFKIECPKDIHRVYSWLNQKMLV